MAKKRKSYKAYTKEFKLEAIRLMKESNKRSSQGSTYASGGYQQLLQEHRLICSMSRKVAAKQSLFEYIEVFYNRRGRHSYLGNVSSAEYEGRYVPH